MTPITPAATSRHCPGVVTRSLSKKRRQQWRRNSTAGPWGRPVQLLTVLDKQGKRLVAKGGEVSVSEATEAEARCTGDGDARPRPREAG